MADVFISYACEDRERASKLASALEAHGWSVWWDRKITVGQSFDQVIEHELDTAKSVIALWSKNSISSEWVKNEAAIAAERGVLLPALIDRVKLPLEFRRKQTADLIGWDGDVLHRGFQDLCDGITAKANISGIAPPQVDIGQYRSVAATLSNDKINSMLVKHGFYDKIRNASGKGIVHKYEPQAIADAVVVLDHATDLMWQKGGSEDPMTLADAENYISRLNAERFAGFSDWHLPTLEEAMSLMEPQAYNELYIAQVFQMGVTFIWTVDRTTDGRGWVLYFYDGILTPENVNFNAWVRAVR
jgi:hypothetical protein